MFSSPFHNKYPVLIRLIFALTALCCIDLSAQTPYSELKAKLNQALEENAEEVGTEKKKEEIGQIYITKLYELKTESQERGNLEALLAVQDEINRFEKSESLPDAFSSVSQLAHLQRVYAKEIKKIKSEELEGALRYYNAYSDSLLDKEKELVRIGYIDQAIEVREERVRVKDVTDELIEEQSALLPSSTPEEVIVDNPFDDRPTTQNQFSWERETGSRQYKDTVMISGKPRLVRSREDLPMKALDKLKAQLEKLKEAHWELVAKNEQKLYKAYNKELHARKFHYQNQGDLDGVLALRAAMERLEENGTIPRSDTPLRHYAQVQDNFAKDIRELKSADRERLVGIYRQYIDELDNLEKSYVQQGKVDQAIVVRVEKIRAQRLAGRTSQKRLILNVRETSGKEEDDS